VLCKQAFRPSAARPMSAPPAAAAAPHSSSLQRLGQWFRELRQEPAGTPAPRHSPFDRLSSVECQLLFQWLPSSDKCCLARCSKRLLAEAQQPFAWKGAEPWPLRLRKPEPGQPRQLPGPVPYTRALVSRLPQRMEMGELFLSSALFAQLAETPGLLLRTVSRAVLEYPPLMWQGVLCAPAFRQSGTIRELQLGDTPLSMQLLLAVSRMQALRKFGCTLQGDFERERMWDANPLQPGEVLGLVCRASNLTELTIDCRHVPQRETTQWLAPLARMPRLTLLELVCARFPPDGDEQEAGQPTEVRSVSPVNAATSFRRFFNATSFPHLEQLSLVDMNAREIVSSCAVDAGRPHHSGFATLPALRTLRLTRVRGVDALLAEIAARVPTVLCALVLHVLPSRISSPADASPYPSAAAVRRFYHALPAVHVRLRTLTQQGWADQACACGQSNDLALQLGALMLSVATLPRVHWTLDDAVWRDEAEYAERPPWGTVESYRG